MTRTNDRDDAAMERLLKGALGRGAPRGACLDAQTLAAWADDELDAKARAAAEAHAADCARCQALLAAMVRTEEVAPDAQRVRAWWRRPLIGWLVPAAAAATLLLAWVFVPTAPPGEDRALPAEAQMGRKDAIGPSPTAPSASEKGSSRAVESMAANAPARPAEAPAAPAIAAREAPAPPPAPSAMPEAGAGARAQTAQAETRSSTGSLAETITPAPLAGIAGGIVGDVARDTDRPASANAVAPVVIVSPDSNSRWRIAPNGGVERSTDAGSTWALQQAGAAVAFTAGSSPSATVCWLVGPNGAIVLSTDGATWRRLPFPEQTLLVAVRAIDERSATVTTAAGIVFGTADGGLTWTPIPPK